MSDTGAAFDAWVTEATGGLGLTTADVQQAIWFQAGWDAYAERVQNWLGIVSAGLRLPTQDTLARARRHTNEPCSRGRKNRADSGKVGCDCSRCTRFIAAWLNRAAYGQPDYPGVAQATQLRKAS